MTDGSPRLAVLEVMVEMLTAQSMAMEADPDQAMDDYRDVAAMMLSRRRPESAMSGLLAIMDERLMKVREHLGRVEHARRQMRNSEGTA